MLANFTELASASPQRHPPFNNFLLISYFLHAVLYIPDKTRRRVAWSRVVLVWCHRGFPSIACSIRWQVQIANSLRRLLFAREADRVVHCLGDKNQDSCALQHSDLSPPLCALLCGKKQPVMIGLKASACAVLHLSTATAHSPCLPSETCTSFQANDTIWYAVGVIHVDNVSMWSSLQKGDDFLLWFFFIYLFFFTH